MKRTQHFLITILFFSMSLSYSQTEAERRKIANTYDSQASIELQNYLESEFEKSQQRISAYLNSLTDAERNQIDLDKLRDVSIAGIPLFCVSHNSSSATTIRADHLHTGGSLGLDLNGQNMIAGVWEAQNGYPLTTHLDLLNRITIIDGGASVNFHATHVTGTIISSGDNIALNLGRGIAYQASVLAANSSNDTSEMSIQASQGLLVSNHSYGLQAGSLPLWRFGAYSSDSFNLDLITSTYPYYLPVVSAGNDRDNFSAYNPTKAGYDLLTGLSNGKNGITSAAVNTVLNYTQPSDVNMSTFSNWGPTDDGRIKPDISSKGVGVLSTSNASNTAYANSQGTSMSAPAISGLLLLLQQHYNNVNNNYMLSATARGLLLHTADEAGPFQGPDYSFGWGLANGSRAASLISNNNTTSFIQETQLNEGETNTLSVEAYGNEPLMVSICWTDPAGSPVNGTVDDLTPDLVNDLDIKLSSNGTDYYPWKLNVVSPSSAATRNSTNDVDNFEKVEVDSPNANEVFMVTVNHKNQLQSGQQNYSIIISGGFPTNLGADDYQLTNSLSLYPNPSNNGKFSINFNMTSIEDVNIDVFDITGRLVLNKTYLDSSDRFNETITLPDANTGVYIVKITSGNSTVSKKLVIN